MIQPSLKEGSSGLGSGLGFGLMIQPDSKERFSPGGLMIQPSPKERPVRVGGQKRVIPILGNYGMHAPRFDAGDKNNRDKQSGHQNIVIARKLLRTNDGDTKQSGHSRRTATARLRPRPNREGYTGPPLQLPRHGDQKKAPPRS